MFRPRVPRLREDAPFEHRLSERGELLGAGAADGLVELVPEDGDHPSGSENAVNLRNAGFDPSLQDPKFRIFVKFWQ